jgi:hypothetical protein
LHSVAAIVLNAVRDADAARIRSSFQTHHHVHTVAEDVADVYRGILFPRYVGIALRLGGRKCTADIRCLTNPEGPNRPSRLARVSGLRLNLDPDAAASARLTMYSQVAQEIQYILLVGCAQHIELSDYPVRLRATAGVLLDRG